MRIPLQFEDKNGRQSSYFERMNASLRRDFHIDDQDVIVLYEEPHAGYTYGCSPDDVMFILEHVARLLPKLPEFVVFRQPTRKQKQQRPVWGRCVYWAEIGDVEGEAIFLDAQEIGSIIRYSKKMSIEDRDEFERLKDEGHEFVEDRRYFETRLTEETIRSTLLYRTFLHELGHLRDFYKRVLLEDTALDPDTDVAYDLYFSRPASEREVFAHQFSELVADYLRSEDIIPFSPRAFDDNK